MQMKQRLSPATVSHYQEVEHSSNPSQLLPLTESQKNVLLKNEKKKREMLPELLPKNGRSSRASPHITRYHLTEEDKPMEASETFRQCIQTDYSL